MEEFHLLRKPEILLIELSIISWYTEIEGKFKNILEKVDI